MKIFFPEDFEKKQVDAIMRDSTGTVLKRLVISLAAATAIMCVVVLIATH